MPPDSFTPPRLARELYAAPFDLPFENALETEYFALSASRRWQAIRKWLQRKLLLAVSGQSALQRARVPPHVRRLLWVHTWTTVGDAILDLAARALIPAGIQVELCIAPALAPLFERDARFACVHTNPAACGEGHDFVLLDGLSTASIRLKMQHWRGLPFASLRAHLLGERFDRAAFGDLRVRQLFGLAPGPVTRPFLSVMAPARDPLEASAQLAVAVPLGARVEAKRYPHWPATLEALVARWPAAFPPPRFDLLGHGATARADLQGFDAEFIAQHCRVAIDSGTLRDAAQEIAGCDVFLGVDGGLMHVAVGVGVPGLALFTRVDPAWFLRPDSGMVALRTDGPLMALPPEAVALRFLDGLGSLKSGERASPLLR